MGPMILLPLLIGKGVSGSNKTNEIEKLN